MEVITLQIYYNMNIIKYKVKYILYFMIFLLRNKKKRLPIQTAPLGIMKPSR